VPQPEILLEQVNVLSVRWIADDVQFHRSAPEASGPEWGH
jgi:hypothetical protein